MRYFCFDFTSSFQILNTSLLQLHFFSAFDFQCFDADSADSVSSSSFFRTVMRLWCFFENHFLVLVLILWILETEVGFECFHNFYVVFSSFAVIVKSEDFSESLFGNDEVWFFMPSTVNSDTVNAADFVMKRLIEAVACLKEDSGGEIGFDMLSMINSDKVNSADSAEESVIKTACCLKESCDGNSTERTEETVKAVCCSDESGDGEIKESERTLESEEIMRVKSCLKESYDWVEFSMPSMINSSILSFTVKSLFLLRSAASSCHCCCLGVSLRGLLREDLVWMFRLNLSPAMNTSSTSQSQ